MNSNFSSDLRVPPWIFVLGAIAAIWMISGRSTAPVVSGWSGDGVAAQSAVGVVPALATQQNGLSALFSRQNEPGSTGLAGAPQPQDVPWGNPTDSSRAVMTQGYGIGTHAPAHIWGGVDIAIDGDGNGQADPQGSMGAPLYATMAGVIELTYDSWPAGNHIWIKNGRYKVGYGHMKEFAVQNGQTVQRGDLIGYMGSSGQSSGPHLHYHIWEDGVNVNPLNFGAMDGGQ
jgi:murein DD-endopeptidase MepM/ murein hydrolase activator NlpD